MVAVSSRRHSFSIFFSRGRRRHGAIYYPSGVIFVVIKVSTEERRRRPRDSLTIFNERGITPQGGKRRRRVSFFFLFRCVSFDAISHPLQSLMDSKRGDTERDKVGPTDVLRSSVFLSLWVGPSFTNLSIRLYLVFFFLPRRRRKKTHTCVVL